MTYLHLFFEFFKTGLLAIGGGLTTIPFLSDIAEKHDWYTQQELTFIIAISESTPGPLGINMATYAGFSTAGILGGIIATLSLVLPSVIIVLIISRFMEKFGKSRIIIGMFEFLRPAAAGLIFGAVVLLLSLTLRIEAGQIALYAALTALCGLSEWKKLNVHPIVFIIIGAIAGM
jgi:chromate transporter